jgi:hypothetical protein
VIGMAYVTAEARQELLDTVAEAADRIAVALAALGDAYELLDEQAADRMEEALFRPVQTAYGRAKRTHTDFAQRYGLPTREFATAPQTAPHSPAETLTDAIDAAADADDILSELQDSLSPVEVGDPELRAGLADVRRHLGDVATRAPQVLRTLGR